MARNFVNVILVACLVVCTVTPPVAPACQTYSVSWCPLYSLFVGGCTQQNAVSIPTLGTMLAAPATALGLLVGVPLQAFGQFLVNFGNALIALAQANAATTTTTTAAPTTTAKAVLSFMPAYCLFNSKLAGCPGAGR